MPHCRRGRGVIDTVLLSLGLDPFLLDGLQGAPQEMRALEQVLLRGFPTAAESPRWKQNEAASAAGESGADRLGLPWQQLTPCACSLVACTRLSTLQGGGGNPLPGAHDTAQRGRGWRAVVGLQWLAGFLLSVSFPPTFLLSSNTCVFENTEKSFVGSVCRIEVASLTAKLHALL